uniref:AlgX/AlgJ SGNH hydrolase-like domain-containing protein n=1 Tax=Desulfovibrio sp. U5L TaxID=596152 RepID=I2Q354_9BACT
MPVLLSADGDIRFEKLEEYRKLQEFPAFDMASITQWTKKVELWFNDNNVLRAPLTRLAGALDYRVFDYSDRVYVGKNNLMFYRNVMDNQLFKNYLCARDTQFKDFLELLSYAQKKLEQKNIKLLLVVCPLKWMLYKDSLPQDVPRADPEYFIALNKTLKSKEGLIYVDALEILQNLKQNKFQTFHTTDFHWTDPAAYFVAQKILECLLHREGKAESVHSLQIEPLHHFVGGQSRFLPLFDPISEESISSVKNWDDAGIVQSKIDENPYEFVSERKGAPLPPTVFLGNSFGDGFTRNGFNSYFEKFYKIDRDISLREAIDIAPKDAKYFIWEIIEVQLSTEK